ncbi:MAG: ATP-binding protein [bacterium]|nr:ATP-binding protein [bacterium]
MKTYKIFPPAARDTDLPAHLAWMVDIERKAVIPSKWTLLFTSYLLTGIQRGSFSIPPLIFGLLALYGLSNLFYSYIYYFRRYQKREILILSYLSLAVDIVVVTLLIFLTGRAESHGTLRSDFYLLYFLVILRGIVLFPNKTMSVVINLIISLLYIFTLISTEHNLLFFSSYEFISKLVLIWAVMLISWFILEIVRSQREKIQADFDQMRNMEQLMLRTEKLASMGEIAAGIAHEINNPVGIITANADYLLKNNPLDSAERDNLKVIQTEAIRCKKIISQLVQLTSPTGGAVEPVDVNGIISDTILEIQQLPCEKKNRIQTQLDQHLPLIIANPSLLQRAIFNLMRNACEAMAQSGGELTVSTAVVEAKREQEVEVRVQDTGIGIAPENQTRIFTPFYTTKSGNLGLGLAITHRIIDWHNGTITIESQSGSGTLIILRLPMKSDTEKRIREENEK